MGSRAFHHESKPSTPVPEASPAFLQPQHHPHLPMPDLWSTHQYTRRLQHALQPSINPELLRAPIAHRDVFPYQQAFQDPINNSFENRGSYQPTYTQNAYNNTYSDSLAPNVPSSPATQMPMRPVGFNQYTPPALGHMQTTTFSPYGAFDYGVPFGSPIRDMTSQPQRSYSINDAWERDRFENTWASQPGHEATASRQVESPALSSKEPTPPLALQYRSSSTATPFLLGTPIAVPLGQPTLDMLPPKKRSRTELRGYIDTNEGRDYEEEVGSRKPLAPATVPILPNQSTQQSSVRRSSVRAPRLQGQYIHSICGRTFASRYAVKKHHWGTKTDDLETSTGCWFKNGRPNVQWDEHPSCRDQQTSKMRYPKSHRPGTNQTTAPEFRAPVVPAMAPNPQNTIPGFLTHSDLPQTVAETLRRSPTPPHSPQVQTLPYHTSRLPIRGSLDNLLTAVNVAIKIDAPTPQGRNDSVVSHLDAQAAAAEERRYQPSSWPGASREQLDPAFSYHALPPLSQVGLGVTQAQPDAAPRMLTSVDDDQGILRDQPQVDMDAPAEERETGKRDRLPRSSISIRELKLLGLKDSPGTEGTK